MTIEKIEELQNNLHGLLLRYLNGSRLKGKDDIKLLTKLGKDFEPNNTKKISIELILIEGYKKLQYEIDKINLKLKKQELQSLQTFDKWKAKAKGGKYLKPIFDMATVILDNSDLFLYAGFHGSFSTLDYIEDFSDLDTILIIKKETIFDKIQLRKARKIISKSIKYLYQMCIFQHHFHFIVTEIDLKFYPNKYFPTELFKYTTQILNKNQIIYNLRKDKNEELKILNDLKMLYEEGNFKNIQKQKSLFGLIEYNQCLLIQPALWYGLIDKPIYKKYSFEKLYYSFDNNITKVVKNAEEVRNRIKISPVPFRKLVDIISFINIPHLYHLFFKIITSVFYKRQKKIVIKKLEKDSSQKIVQLINEMLRSIDDNR